jgi:hypothetical protein
MPPYFAITNRFWKKPKNADQIVEAVAWAAHDTLPVHISGPDYLVANLVSQHDQKRSILHLVNYNAKRAPGVSSVDVTVTAPGTASPSVTLLSPDNATTRTLTVRSDSTGVHFQIPQVETYSVIVVSWQ